MKSEQFKRATKVVQDAVVQSVKQQMPVLDYVMQVDKMSPTDKIFFDAYKQYGNRNHTWQDFKAMFNGDIDTMQSTIKHWKTWDEINSIYYEIQKQRVFLLGLLNKYGFKSFGGVDYKKYEKQFPDLVAAFERYVDLSKTAYVNYSTFDAKIAKLEKQFEKEKSDIAHSDEEGRINLITKYIKMMSELVDLQNGDFVTAERVEIYKNIILSNPKILEMAQNFEHLSQEEIAEFANMILSASGKRFGTVGDVFLGGKSFYCHASKAINLNPDCTERAFPLAEFLVRLVHEDSHRIDYQNPNMGMIGSQIMNWQRENVLLPEHGKVSYRAQPTEQGAYYVGDPVATGIYVGLKKYFPDR